jgi:heme oxygenase
MLLENLLAVYQELERGLSRHEASPIFSGVRWTMLRRGPAIEQDLLTVAGPDWRRSVVLFPSGKKYVDGIAQAGAGNGERLMAHAYVRYLGDLSGGQILRRILGRSLGLGPDALSFYEFPAIDDLAGFKSTFRAAIDAAGAGMVDVEAVVDESEVAFRLNIELSEAIQAADAAR